MRPQGAPYIPGLSARNCRLAVSAAGQRMLKTVEPEALVTVRLNISVRSMIKTIKILLATAFLSHHVALAAKVKIDSAEPGIREEPTALVEAWIVAEVQSDRSALEAILHEDFLSTFASGTTLDRTACIDSIVGPDIAPSTVRTGSML